MYNLRRYLLFSSLLVDIIFTNLQAAQVEKLGQGITIPSAVASYAGNMQAPAFNFEQKLKNYYPVSPSAARLIDEINYPVDYSTGAMNLSIPIYEIRTRDFVLPITLKCVTTGIKAFRNNYNRVGIGWDLEVEPMITREIHGNDDDYGYLNYDSRFNNPRQQYLLNIVKNGLDSEPDVFYFRTLTNSGKFMFKKPENETSPKYVPLFFPASAEKITVPSTLNKGIRMQDEKGNLYIFGGQDYSVEQTRSRSNNITTWKASSIVSPQQDILRFSYSINNYTRVGCSDNSATYDFCGVEDMGPNESLNPTPDGIVPNCGYWKGIDNAMNYYQYNGHYIDSNGNFNLHSFILSPNFSSNQRYTNGVPMVFPTVLSRIDFEGGYVTFESDQRDMLSRICVYEGGTLIQTVDFIYQPYDNQAPSVEYKLSELLFTDCVTTKIQRYRFGYNEPNRRHYGNDKNVDFWGYYNIHIENTDLVPRQTIMVGIPGGSDSERNSGHLQIGGANRSPDMACLQYTIKEIIYPSGEKDEFFYELNEYIDSKDRKTKPAGGLRIRRIRTSDIDGQWYKEREFFYKDGKAWIPPELFLFEQEHAHLYYFRNGHMIRRRYRTFSSSPCMSLSLGAAPVLYGSVREEVKDKDNHREIKEYTYSNYSNFSSVAGGTIQYFPDDIDSWKQNELINIKIFGDSITPEGFISHRQIKQTTYDSNNYLTYSTPENYQTKSLKAFLYTLIDYPDGRPEYEYDYTINFGMFNYDMSQSRPRERSYTEWQIEGNDTIYTSKEYKYGKTNYDVSTGNPTGVVDKNSDETTIEQQFIYPYHKDTDVSREMVANNDLTRLLEERYISTTPDLKKREKCIVYDYGIQPCGSLPYAYRALKESASALSDLKDVESYNRYDCRGNIVEYTRKDGVTITLLWGYNYQKLVAQIIGASFSSCLTESQYTALQSKTSMELRSFLQSMLRPVSQTFSLFTWYPTRGLESVSDAMGVTTYYEYDGFGRLIRVRDTDKEIKEEYEYNIRN